MGCGASVDGMINVTPAQQPVDMEDDNLDQRAAVDTDEEDVADLPYPTRPKAVDGTTIGMNSANDSLRVRLRSVVQLWCWVCGQLPCVWLRENCHVCVCV